jgi:hypothetical protein
MFEKDWTTYSIFINYLVTRFILPEWSASFNQKPFIKNSMVDDRCHDYIAM